MISREQETRSKKSQSHLRESRTIRPPPLKNTKTPRAKPNSKIHTVLDNMSACQQRTHWVAHLYFQALSLHLSSVDNLCGINAIRIQTLEFIARRKATLQSGRGKRPRKEGGAYMWDLLVQRYPKNCTHSRSPWSPLVSFYSARTRDEHTSPFGGCFLIIQKLRLRMRVARPPGPLPSHAGF